MHVDLFFSLQHRQVFQAGIKGTRLLGDGGNLQCSVDRRKGRQRSIEVGVVIVAIHLPTEPIIELSP